MSVGCSCEHGLPYGCVMAGIEAAFQRDGGSSYFEGFRYSALLLYPSAGGIGVSVFERTPTPSGGGGVMPGAIGVGVGGVCHGGGGGPISVP